MDSNIIMVCICYDKEKYQQIMEGINTNTKIANLLRNTSVTSNEFTYTKDGDLNIYQILTDLKFSTTCLYNEIIQFHFYTYEKCSRNTFSVLRTLAYNHLCFGEKINKLNSIKHLGQFTLTYDTLMNPELSYAWCVNHNLYITSNCDNYQDILDILYKTMLPTELCLIILTYLNKQINFNITCYKSRCEYVHNKPYGFLCNPCLII